MYLLQWAVKLTSLATLQSLQTPSSGSIVFGGLLPPKSSWFCWVMGERLWQVGAGEQVQLEFALTCLNPQRGPMGTNLSPVTDSPTAEFSHTWWPLVLTWPTCQPNCPVGGFLLQLPEEANVHSLKKWHSVSLLSTDRMCMIKVISLGQMLSALMSWVMLYAHSVANCWFSNQEIFPSGGWGGICCLPSSPWTRRRCLIGWIVANSCITCFWSQPSFEEFLQVLAADAESPKFSQAMRKLV